MKKLTKTLGATLAVGVISITSFATIASANEQNNRFGPNAGRFQGPHNGQQFRGPRGNSGLGPIRLVCSDRGEARIKNVLERIANRIELSSDQVTALANFKTAALSAQAGFNEVCADFKPGKNANLIKRMNSHQAAIAARLVGMQSVMPTLEVFFDSLSDQQKVHLRPPVDKRGQRGFNHHPRPNQNMNTNSNKG